MLLKEMSHALLQQSETYRILLLDRFHTAGELLIGLRFKDPKTGVREMRTKVSHAQLIRKGDIKVQGLLGDSLEVIAILTGALF
jgi:hypothetical protein